MLTHPAQESTQGPLRVFRFEVVVVAVVVEVVDWWVVVDVGSGEREEEGKTKEKTEGSESSLGWRLNM